MNIQNNKPAALKTSEQKKKKNPEGFLNGLAVCYRRVNYCRRLSVSLLGSECFQVVPLSHHSLTQWIPLRMLLIFSIRSSTD